MLEKLLRILFPTFCIGCDQYGEILCKKCERFLYRTNPECIYCRKIHNKYVTHESCQKEEHIISVAYTCFIYNWLGKRVMKKLKFEGARNMEVLLLKNLSFQISEISKSLKSDGQPTFIIPIPLHRKRLVDRGYNQIDFFAKFLADQDIGSKLDNLLIKVQNSKSQSHKTLDERAYEGENPFTINLSASPYSTKNKDPAFIIVDDVITTGNTLIMASRALKAQFPNATIKAIALFRPVFKGEKPV